MKFVTTIEYLIIAMIGFYLSGVVSVWIYELKINALYRKMKQQIRLLESLHLSMALLHAKIYKIEADYHKNISELERVQQFIYKNVLLIGGVHRLSSPSPRAGRR